MRPNVSYFQVFLLFAGLTLLACPHAHAQNANANQNTNAKRLVTVPISDAPSYAKCALVIGVTNYALAPHLHVCGNDANEFADLLKTKMGFSEVTLMTDDEDTPIALRPTRTNLRRAIHALLTGIEPGKSEVVLFYSGHGVRYGDSDWLVPEDGDPQDIAGTCLNYSQIVQAVNTARPARTLLVTDACRSLLSGKAAGEGSGFGKGLGGQSLGPEVAELLSCAPTEVSQEGLDRDFKESVFTHFLVKGLEGDPNALDAGTKNVTFDSLMEYLRWAVKGYVRSRFNGSQTPDGRATLGRMVLARATVSAIIPTPVEKPPLTPEQQQQANDRLLSLWKGTDGKYDDAKAQAITVTAVQQALDQGADVNASDLSVGTALRYAAHTGNAEVVRFLLDRGADVNANNANGGTVLGNAVGYGHADIVRLLLERGADVHTRNKYGATPLSLAIKNKQSDIAAMLRAAGETE